MRQYSGCLPLFVVLIILIITGLFVPWNYAADGSGDEIGYSVGYDWQRYDGPESSTLRTDIGK